MTASKPKRVIHLAIVSSDIQAEGDKDSIPDQLKRQRKRSQDNGWQVVDEIIVDFSRRYYTYLEFATEALNKDKEPAPMRMFRHWNERTFDILSCRDLSRLGREQSILSEVISRTIDINAIIMPLDEATVDKTNYRFASAFAGLSASQHIDNLIRYRELGMSKNASLGKKVGVKPPRFYVEILDDKGKPVGIRPDRARYQRFFDDFVTVYCHLRTPYRLLGQVLYDDFGHVDPLTSRAYTQYVLHDMLYHPATWGHTAYGKRRNETRNQHRWEFWITGDEPPPEVVKFFPNTVEPIWPSPILERMKAEFRHRHYTMKGRMASRSRYLFSGLLVCEECGSGFSGTYHKHGNYMYYRCTGRYGSQRTDCPNISHISESVIVDWLRPYIERLKLAGSLDILPEVLPTQQSDVLTAIDNEIAEAETAARNLVQNIGKQGEHIARVMQQELDALNDTIARLQYRHVVVSAETAASKQATVDRREAVADLQAFDIDEFWSQEPYVINQWLHRLLGNVRIAIRDREVTGFVIPKG